MLVGYLEATLLLLEFFEVFDSIQRAKMEQILQACSHFRETFIAIMMLYTSSRSKVFSPNKDADFLDIVA